MQQGTTMRHAMIVAACLLLGPAATAQPRFPPLDPAAMTAQQTALHDAIMAGLEAPVIADLQEGRRPGGMTPDEATVYDFATQLHRQHQVSDAAYKGALAQFGEQGIMDLIAVLGYCDLVRMTLNVAQVQPPAETGATLAAPGIPR